MDLVKEIRKFLKGDVENSEDILDRYSRDASLFTIRPKVVVFPKHEKDVMNLISFVNKQRALGGYVYLTPRSGGTDMTGGSLGASIIVEFDRYMNRFKGVKKHQAVVEPGMYFRDFDKETKKKGFILPSYPASREICAVGGMVGNNAGGEKNLVYGKTERYVKELTVVLRDGRAYSFGSISMEELEEKKRDPGLEGELYRSLHKLIADNYERIKSAEPNVSKNSSGYYLWNVWDKERGTFDLSKLLVGSQGTLGIITRITFDLVRPKPCSAMLVMFLDDISHLGEIVNHTLSHKPESFESYDDHTFKLAIKFFPEFAVRLKTNLIHLAWQFIPEAWMMLTGGVPKLVLLVEFTGSTAKEAHRKAQEAEEDINASFTIRTKITRTPAETQKYWVMRRESFNLLRKRIRGLRTAPFIDDFVVQPQYLPEFLPRLEKILSRYKGLIYTVAGHAGDGNFHIIPLMDPKDPNLIKKIRAISDKVYKLVLEYNGSISGEHNDGLVRAPYVKDMFGSEMYALFEEVKRIFDPEGIFNPGKKVGVAEKTVYSHIDIPKNIK